MQLIGGEGGARSGRGRTRNCHQISWACSTKADAQSETYLRILRGLPMSFGSWSMQSMSPISGISSSLSNSLLLSRSTDDVSLFGWRSKSAIGMNESSISLMPTINNWLYRDYNELQLYNVPVVKWLFEHHSRGQWQRTTNAYKRIRSCEGPHLNWKSFNISHLADTQRVLCCLDRIWLKSALHLEHNKNH